MREILFRGKPIQNVKETIVKIDNTDGFIYGNLLCTQNDDRVWIDIPYYGAIIVDPNTIGQFTGLCDKHGNKIFEGDVILTQPIKTRSYSKNAKTKQRLGRVIWCDGKRDGNTFITEPSFNVEFVDKEDKYCRWDWSLFYDCEVVGNIYDNPDLAEDNNG